MTDLVNVLRTLGETRPGLQEEYSGVLLVAVQAADEIERLQAENRALRNLAANLRPGPISEALEGERYRDALRQNGEP